jgi:hypothetical protein
MDIPSGIQRNFSHHESLAYFIQLASYGMARRSSDGTVEYNQSDAHLGFGNYRELRSNNDKSNQQLQLANAYGN